MVERMGIRILVIEDEAELADFLVRGLREEGFTVAHATDGESAWQKLAMLAKIAEEIELAIAALIGLAWRYRRQFPLATYGFFTFLVLMAPTSSIVPILFLAGS